MALQEDRQPNGREDAMVFYESGKHAGQPGFNSTKVGWTLRNSRGKIVAGFAYYLNPQGISRTVSSRSQVFATKGGFYIDNFGPGPNQISVRQIVASGKKVNAALGYTAREDIQRFLKTIYLPVVQRPDTYKAYFHDHHFERGFEEQVFFPQGGLVIQRAVDMHNTWLVELQMIGLERFPFTEVEDDIAPRIATRRYRVKKGDTVTKLAARLAGKGASAQRRKALVTRIYQLNPAIKKKRHRKTSSGTQTLKAMHIYAGEVILLPA